jgi:6-phosphogluconolactonase (cycloisomerase 2 family)
MDLTKNIGVVAVLLLLALCVGCGSGAGGSRVLYAVSPTSNQVATYSLSGMGAIGSSVSAGTTPLALAVHPSGKFVYTANFGSNSISLLTAQSNGSLGSTSTTTDTGLRPVSIAIDASGKYLYTADQAGESISAFTIDSSSGALTSLGGPYAIGFTPSAMTLSPSGDLLFVAAQGYVLVFTVSGGTPTFVTYYAAAIFPTSLAVDPSEKFLYIADIYNNTIDAFTIGSGGVLTAVSGSPFSVGGGQPQSLAIDSSGTYLFSANHSTDNVSVLKIDSTTGALSLISGAPFAAGTGPAFVVYDKSTAKVYVSNQTSNNISTFAVGSDGTLTSAGTSDALTGLTWIATGK